MTTPQSNMIERVAGAIAVANCKKGARCGDLARAAIEAMREPPPDVNYRFEMISPAYKSVWAAMIDAALTADKCGPRE